MLATFAALILAFQRPVSTISPWESEVIYQIFPRSFRDSDGDRIGDFKGIAEKLDYIKRLGATTILINPIQQSRMYHNYFADDFYKTDPKFGTNKDFFDLVKQAHRRHLKVLLDMEVQYVADQHPWYVARQKDPASPYASYLWDNKGFYTAVPLPMWDGSKISAASVDLNNPEVRKYMTDLFRYWAAPEGHRADGVDGFRIDHMMDDLDRQGKLKGLLAGFWRPLIEDLRRYKPGIFFLGEQADWSMGTAHLVEADVDAVYAFPLAGAMLDRDPSKIEKTATTETAELPPRKTFITMIENHDFTRFASTVDSNPSLLRLGAALEMTMRGTPLVYYGQEIGMVGKKGDWNTDGNDIPMRLAMRWTKSPNGAGAANWYGQGPWAEAAKANEVEGMSVEEQDRDPRSLLNFYRHLIGVRRSNATLRQGILRFIDMGNRNVLAFLRETRNATDLVVANLGEKALNLPLPAGMRMTKDLWLESRVLDGDPGTLVEVSGYGFRILEVRTAHS